MAFLTDLLLQVSKACGLTLKDQGIWKVGHHGGLLVPELS